MQEFILESKIIQDDRINKLKELFPECFDKEGKLLIDKLEKSLWGGGASRIF